GLLQYLCLTLQAVVLLHMCFSHSSLTVVTITAGLTIHGPCCQSAVQACHAHAADTHRCMPPCHASRKLWSACCGCAACRHSGW
ncbi:hypothetical protein COO60DRAFT_1549423, partial [Scenedesmus sp. NREL 46B-D3]